MSIITVSSVCLTLFETEKNLVMQEFLCTCSAGREATSWRETGVSAFDSGLAAMFYVPCTVVPSASGRWGIGAVYVWSFWRRYNTLLGIEVQVKIKQKRTSSMMWEKQKHIPLYKSTRNQWMRCAEKCNFWGKIRYQHVIILKHLLIPDCVLNLILEFCLLLLCIIPASLSPTVAKLLKQRYS